MHGSTAPPTRCCCCTWCVQALTRWLMIDWGASTCRRADTVRRWLTWQPLACQCSSRAVAATPSTTWRGAHQLDGHVGGMCALSASQLLSCWCAADPLHLCPHCACPLPPAPCPAAAGRMRPRCCWGSQCLRNCQKRSTTSTLPLTTPLTLQHTASWRMATSARCAHARMHACMGGGVISE